MLSSPSLGVGLRSRRTLLLLMGAALVVVLGLLASQVWSSRGEALQEAAAKTHNYAAIIEARLDATLRRTDSVLLAQVHELPPAALARDAVSGYAATVNADLDRYLINFVELNGLRVFDAQGELLYTSASERPPRANIADRSYFRKLRDDPRAGVVFSEVIQITATGRQGLVAARAVRDAQGALVAVVLALIDLDYFKTLFRTLDVGANGVVAIRRSDDFSAVVRWPTLQREVNRPLPPGNPAREALQAGQASGTLEMPAASDGVFRTYSYRSVAGYPFFVGVALAHVDALAGWRARSLTVGGVGLLLLALLVALLARLWRMEVREARATHALRASEERLRLALEASRQGLYDLNVQTGQAEVNAQYALMLGYEPAQFQETNQAWIERLHPDDLERVAGVYRDYIAGRMPDYRVECRQRMRDGRYKWILSVGKIVEADAQGRPLRMLGTHRDISDIKDAEAALRRLNEELESRVEQRTAELVQARDEAERASRAKSEFLSGMSHELRTPMNAILGFSQLLEREPTFVVPGKPRGYLQEILRAGQHLLELIDDLLDLARIEAGKQQVTLEAVPVATLVADCISLIGPVARDRRITLLNGVPAAFDGHVCADRMRLKQVLLNLLSNAVKYNREGGSVQVACDVDGDGMRISVTDSGPGLSVDEQTRLFQTFERLAADKTAIKGAGIGLALSKRLVDLMHGEIGVRSEVGAGSTFWIRLARAQGANAAPAAPAPAAASSAEPAHATAPDAVRSVLYIEDDPVNLLLMEAALERLPGWRLVTAPLPALGLDIARAERPDLILLDIQLPGIDGYEVLRLLRASDVTCSIPVIAVSANAMTTDVARGDAAGFAAYVTKPIDFARLLALMDEATRTAKRR